MRTLKVENTTLYVPDSSSPCETWKTYFAQLKGAVGKSNARTLWLFTWDQAGDTGCTTSSDFNRWLKANGLDVSNAATRALADVSGLGEHMLGLGKNLTKVVSLGVPVLLAIIVLVVGITLVRVGKNADLGDLAMLTPAGRVAHLSSGLLTRKA